MPIVITTHTHTHTANKVFTGNNILAYTGWHTWKIEICIYLFHLSFIFQISFKDWYLSNRIFKLMALHLSNITEFCVQLCVRASVRMRVCVCVCARACACVWKCIFYACLCVFMSVWTGEIESLCMYVYICVCVCVCVCVCSRMGKCINTCIYLCMWVCVFEERECVCVCVYVCAHAMCLTACVYECVCLEERRKEREETGTVVIFIFSYSKHIQTWNLKQNTSKIKFCSEQRSLNTHFMEWE